MMGVPLVVVLMIVALAAMCGVAVYVVMAGDVPGFDDECTCPHPYDDEPGFRS